MKFSIQNRISLGFMVVIALSSAFLLVGYPFLKKIYFSVSDFIPASQQILILKQSREMLDVLSIDIERYFLVRSGDKKEDLNRQIMELGQKIEELTGFRMTQDLVLEKLNEIILTVEKEFFLVDTFLTKGNSAYVVNKKIILIFQLLDEAKGILRDLSDQIFSEFHEKVEKQKNTIVVLGRFYFLLQIGIVLVGILIAYFLSKFLLSGLHRLVALTEQISRGNFDVNADYKQDDEIARVIRAFKEMGDNLKRTMASREELMAQVSERILAEEKLKVVNKELEKNERALRNMLYDLKKAHDEIRETQSQLVQSEKLASLGQLSAGVAHEINNPMAFIKNNIEVLGKYFERFEEYVNLVGVLKQLILDSNVDQARDTLEQVVDLEKQIKLNFIMNDMRNLLKETHSGIDRIQKIVTDLKTFSRAGGDVMELHSVEEVLNGILNIVHSEIKYKAKLKKEFANVPLIKCNAQKLGQVFINLIVNASHAIGEKGEIILRTFVRDGCVVVEVEDNGRGIAPEHLNKIFDPFFTTKEVGQGTGLGLSVSYDIIRQHQGVIKVESVLNKGSKFSVLLPILEEES